jgi:hypothetical protein
MFELDCMWPGPPPSGIVLRAFAVANAVARAGKGQISLDFTTGQRSIVTFRHEQATRGCESASMPRGGSESVLSLRIKGVGIQGSAFAINIIFRGHTQTNVCGTFTTFWQNESRA